MKKLAIATAFGVMGISSAGAAWSVYPVYLPPEITFIPDITVNASGTGYALTSDGHSPSSCPTLLLNDGTWTVGDNTPTSLVWPSVGFDSTCYARSDDGLNRFIYFYTPPARGRS